MRFIRSEELSKILSVSKPTIWRMEKNGQLPPKRKIGKRAAGWLDTDIEEWLTNRPTVNSSDAAND